MKMSKANEAFVAAVFEMETGFEAKSITRVGFNVYLIETEDGSSIRFKC